jgi:hypothetical protein
MKIHLTPKKRERGFVLLLVVLLAAFSIYILAGVMNRTSTVSLLNLRSTQLNQLDNAAEAAIEKAYSRMAWDFNYGPGTVTNNLSSGVYKALVPTSSDNAYWGNFVFSDPVNGTTNNLYVSFVTNYTGPLPAQFTNQFAYNSPIYRFACNVTQPGSLVNVVGSAQEDVLLALVPITTYAIFYNGELEFTGCATMTVNGRVHSNADICVGAGGGSTLTFNNLVTCCQTLSAPTRASWSYTQFDPTTWLTTFNGSYTTNYQNINIAITMTNTHSIIDIPPAGEQVMSQQGQVRLYNQAQVVLIVTNSPLGGSPQVLLTLQTSYANNLPGADSSPIVYAMTNQTKTVMNTNPISATTIPLPFLTLTNSFVDLRQGNQSQFVTDIDVAAYKDWVATNSKVTGKFTGGAKPTVLYVADRRNIGTTKQSVVRLSNGAQLPPNTYGGLNLGFTVATQNPLYVQGDYNTTTDGTHFSTSLGATTNGYSVPAAVLCDALTLLSANWSDANSALGTGSRRAASAMTFNAAIVTGNVPSTGTGSTQFSGGVHNITRLLEDWSVNSSTLTMNTSIVVLFASQMATNQWQLPYNSSSSGYYNPPTRRWGFDQTYYSPNHQPPGVPCALLPIRFNWSKPAPGSVTTVY